MCYGGIFKTFLMLLEHKTVYYGVSFKHYTYSQKVTHEVTH